MAMFSLPSYAQQAEFIWAEDGPDAGKILLSKYRNGAWQAGETVVDDGQFNFLPALGADSRGRRIAVWTTMETGRSILRYAVQQGNHWSRPGVLTDQMSTNLAPVVVVDRNDTTWVFWAANAGPNDNDNIYASRFTGGSWSAPEQVNGDNKVPDILPEAGLDENGNVWVAWQSLGDDGYVEKTRSYEPASKNRLATTSSAARKHDIDQIRARANIKNPVSPPPFFDSRSRATLIYPDNRERQSKPVQGKW